MKIKGEVVLTSSTAIVISKTITPSFFNKGEIPLILLDMIVLY